MDAADLLRAVNAILALACALGYVHSRIWTGRRARSAEETLLRLGLAVVLFAVSWGSAEAMARGNELVHAQYLLTFGCTGILTGLWLTRPRRE